MTDTAVAQELLQDAFPIRAGRNIKAAIGEAFEALKRHERSLPRPVLQDRGREWTERRVKSIWQREARRIDHYEIEDLTAIAVKEARLERQRLRAREERLAAFLASREASVAGGIGQQAGGETRGLDRAGIGGAGDGYTEADERADQSQGWGR